METKDTLSSCPGSEEQEMQRMQKQAKSIKQSCISFQYVFGRLCGEEFNTFKSTLSNNMDNIDKQLNKEILHKKDSKSALSVIKVQFDKFFHSEVLKPSNYDGENIRNIFKEYTRMEPQSFKDVIIQYMESSENCIDEGALQKRLKMLND
ncbi:hypothetical protein Tco_1007907 [Tanacetum coccineum]